MHQVLEIGSILGWRRIVFLIAATFNLDGSGSREVLDQFRLRIRLPLVALGNPLVGGRLLGLLDGMTAETLARLGQFHCRVFIDRLR